MVLTTHFTLPALPCSFPAKLHPDYERVRTECDPWILGLAHPNVRQVLRDSLLPRYACRLFPLAPDLPRLHNAAKFVGWLTLADDVVDTGPLALPIDDHPASSLRRYPGHALPAPASWAQCVLSKLQYPDHDSAIITSGQCGHHEPEGLILLSALDELWRDVSSAISPHARACFVVAMEQHLEAACLQHSLNSSFLPKKHKLGGSSTMHAAEYMAIRRKSSGFSVGVELLHYALGLDEDLIHLNPLLEELRLLTIDYMCMCNDLVSCRMELASETYFNLPYVVYSNGSAGSLQEAVEIVVEMMERVDARSVAVVDAIKRDHAVAMEKEPRLKAYLENLVSFMSGTLCWSFETVRYGMCDAKLEMSR